MNLKDQSFVTYINKDLMNLESEERPEHLTNRFVFIDNNTFKVLNKEGFEKIVRFHEKIIDQKE